MSGGAPDIDAQFERIETYVRSLMNTRVDPPEPLINDVFELFDNGRTGDNGPHQSPRLGIQHDGCALPKNKLLGGGTSQEGESLWRFVLLVDSPVRGQGMRGPRGARVLTKIFMDAMSGFKVDEENGACPMSLISMIRYVPPEESLKPECGYYLEGTTPVTNESDGPGTVDEEEE